MTRLFITLNIIILGVIIVYALNIEDIAMVMLKRKLTTYYHERGRGTLTLLDRQVSGLNESQRQAFVTGLKPQFPYGIKLKAISSLNLDTHERAKLAQGQPALHIQDQDSWLYKQLPQTSLAWEIALNQSVADDTRHLTRGTMYLIQQTLIHQPQERWPLIIRELGPQFGYPISLEPLAQLKLTYVEHEQLERGEVVVVSLGQFDNRIYQRLADSDWVLMLGELEPSPILRYINAFLLCFLVLLLVGATVAWLWPLWRALIGLREAAEAFGEGDYHARAPHRERSGLSAITAAFNQMAERTQRGIQAHKELTSAVSHELRTPLARMRFSLEMLAMNTHGEAAQRHIHSLDQDIEELSLMLEELLTYARIDHDTVRLSLTQVSLKNWLDQSLERLLSLTPMHKTLEWSFSGSVMSSFIDPRFMRRALDNLVHNAFRHAHAQVRVSLTLDEGWWVLEVDDDGEGIPAFERERLFEAFATMERSRNKAREGFGLGLAIVKRIIDAHQGQVMIEDSPLGGAKVLMRWPAKLELNAQPPRAR